MLDPQSSDMRDMQYMMSALPLSFAQLSKLCIPFLNNILDGLMAKIYLIFIFSLLFWFSTTIFSNTLILSASERNN